MIAGKPGNIITHLLLSALLGSHGRATAQQVDGIGRPCRSAAAVDAWEASTDSEFVFTVGSYFFGPDCGHSINGDIAYPAFRRVIELERNGNKRLASFAATNLANMFYGGRGVPEDNVTAYAWISVAFALSPSPSAVMYETRRNISAELTQEGMARAQAMGRRLFASLVEVPKPRDDGSSPPQGISRGTAFFVSPEGHAITNNHVVSGCSTVKVAGEPAVVVSGDEGTDLALLRTRRPRPEVAIFREGVGIGQGDAVVVLGYPLSGVLSSASPNVTTGVISSLAGPEEDRRLFQITAPIQPGNSGGPLLDASGHVIGVVVSTLSTVRMANATGTIPQNLNFAIKAPAIRALLESHDIAFKTEKSVQKLEASEIAAQARRYTVQVECLK